MKFLISTVLTLCVYVSFANIYDTVNARIQFLNWVEKNGMPSDSPAVEAAIRENNFTQLNTLAEQFYKLNETQRKEFERKLMKSAKTIAQFDDFIKITNSGPLKMKLSQVQKSMDAEFDEYFKKHPLPEIPEDYQTKTDTFIVDINKHKMLSGNEADFPENSFVLTFDDGPSWNYGSEDILDILTAEGVPATYFMLGELIQRAAKTEEGKERQLDLFAKMKNIDVTFGVHGWDHKLFPSMPLEVAKKQITDTQEQIDYVTGLSSQGFFRFPCGAFNQEKSKMLYALDYVNVFWNMATGDFATKHPLNLYLKTVRLIEKEKKGILLFHDIYWQTAKVLPKVIQYLKAKDATFLRLTRENR